MHSECRAGRVGGMVGGPAMPGVRWRVGRRVRGFTLLEVLIAVGVFAFAAMGLMLALEATIDASSAVQRESAIRAQMESRLAKLSIGPYREYSNRSNFEGTQYAEEIRQEEVIAQDQVVLAGYWRVRVVASWRAGGTDQEWDISHLVYQP